MPRGNAGYKRKSDLIHMKRLIVVTPIDQVQAIDEWGVEAGMPSRTATIHHLIEIGLKAVLSEKAAARGDSQVNP